jgi:hypothetical protein
MKQESLECVQVSAYPIAQYNQLARAWFATGRPGHLALELCGQGDRSACVVPLLGSHSDRTWDQVAWKGYRTP